MKYKLMLFDMDGTLLNSEKRIPAETVRMMEKAERAGLQCALAVSYTHLTLPTNREV